MPDKNGLLFRVNTLTDFCTQVFQKIGVPEEDARITADVLVSADLRGIESHGVSRLRRYVDGLRRGMIVADPEVKVERETPATALIDAGAGLGQPVSHRAMQKAIQKAKEVGAGFVTVRNSNHYGIAGYYAMMALQHDCIGMSMTNADVLVVPTFGRNATLGTNPIAVAAPANRERPFVLDMATSTVTRGKSWNSRWRWMTSSGSSKVHPRRRVRTASISTARRSTRRKNSIPDKVFLSIPRLQQT